MKYMVYFRCSLRRRPGEQLLLILLLVCAAALPLCVSMLQSSYSYGARVYNEFVTYGGHAAIVHYAEEGDEALLTGIDGIVPVWEDGVLYLDRTDDNPLLFSEEGPPLDMWWHTGFSPILDQAHNDDIYIENLEGSCTDPHRQDFSPVIHYFLLGIALFTQSSAYAVFWQKKTGDMHTLSAIGATGRQIALLTFVQFLFLQLTSALASFGIVSGAFRLLTERYIGMDWRADSVKVRSSYRWLVFHMDARQIAVIFGWLCVGGALLCVAALILFSRENALSVKKRGGMGSRLCRTSRRAASRTTVLFRILLSKRALWMCVCVLIAVPMLLGVVCIDRLRRAKTPEIDTSKTYIYVMLKTGRCVIWNDELDFLYEIDGVREVKAIMEPNPPYVIQDERANHKWVGVNANHAALYADDALAALPEPYTDTDGTIVYSVAIDNTDLKIQYQVGDRLPLWSGYTRVYTLEVAQVLNSEEAAERRKTLTAYQSFVGEQPNSYYVHFRPQDLTEITEQCVVSALELYPSDLIYSTGIKNAIYSIFEKDDLYMVLDNAADALVQTRRTMGMHILYTAMMGLLFGFFVIITTLSLTEYVHSQRKNLRLLHLQGASHGKLLRTFLLIMMPPGVLCCAAVYAIVPYVQEAYYRLNGYTTEMLENLDLRMTGDPLYLAAAVAVIAVFILPVLLSAARFLRSLDREMVRQPQKNG